MEDIRKSIVGILGEIEFNSHFDVTYDHLTRNQKGTLLEFIRNVKDGLERPIPVPNKDIILFRKAFGSNVRTLVVKVKSGRFKQIFLGKHKYYDEFRKGIGL